MKNEYYVFHKWDSNGATLSDNKSNREIYDKKNSFNELDSALEFAMSVLHEKPILMKYASLGAKGDEQIKNSENSYVVASYFENKYHHYCYDGSSDPVPTHEIERCNRSQLEDKLMNMAQEGPSKLYWGLELKLIPSLEYFK